MEGEVPTAAQEKEAKATLFFVVFIVVAVVGGGILRARLLELL